MLLFPLLALLICANAISATIPSLLEESANEENLRVLTEKTLALLREEVSLPAPFPIPNDVLSNNVTLPDLTGVEALIVGGSKGNGNATAWIAYNQGASVTITSRDRDTVNNSLYNVMDLDYCMKGSVDRFWNKYLQQHDGYRPSLVGLFGLQYYQGDMLDFDLEHMECAMQMYVIGPLYLMGKIIKHVDPDGVRRPLNISIALSAAGYGAGTSFLGLYAGGKAILKDFIRDFAVYSGPHYYPEVRITGIACAYAKTTLTATSYNPSVEKGDALNIKLQQQVLVIQNQVGSNPYDIGFAHMIGLTLLTKANNTIYLVPVLTGRGTSDLLYSIYVSDNTTQFVKDTYVVYNFLGVNIPSYI